MKQTDLHALLLKSPYIHHIETDTNELCECECTLWENSSCTLLIEFAHPINNNHHIFLNAINNKLAWINQNKTLIGQFIIEQTPLFQQYLLKNKSTKAQNFRQPIDANEFIQALCIDYISLYIETADDIFTDFCISVTPDYLQGCTIDVELEPDHNFSIGEINA